MSPPIPSGNWKIFIEVENHSIFSFFQEEIYQAVFRGKISWETVY